MKLGGWVSNPPEQLYLFLMWTLRRDIWHDLEAQKRQKMLSKTLSMIKVLMQPHGRPLCNLYSQAPTRGLPRSGGAKAMTIT